MAKTMRQSRKSRGVAARKQIVEDLFYDFNDNHAKVYWVNFVRGIFFGFGVFLGGTVVVALLVWLLSLFVRIPVVGEYTRSIIDIISQ